MPNISFFSPFTKLQKVPEGIVEGVDLLGFFGLMTFKDNHKSVVVLPFSFLIVKTTICWQSESNFFSSTLAVAAVWRPPLPNPLLQPFLSFEKLPKCSQSYPWVPHGPFSVFLS